MSIFRRRKESIEQSALPDPATKFPHPGNAELFSFLKKEWLETRNPRAEELIRDYPTRTHPDLIERFRSLAPAQDVMQGSAYGCAIMTNSSALVFAWTRGMNDIFLRLPRSLRQGAIDEIGRYDATYPEGWIGFPPFGSRYGTKVNPDEALHRWVRTAYEESLKITTFNESVTDLGKNQKPR